MASGDGALSGGHFFFVEVDFDWWDQAIFGADVIQFCGKQVCLKTECVTASI